MTTQLSPAERAMAIWHRITEEATASNDHGVIYDGEKIAEIIGSAIERAIAEAVEGEREACAKLAKDISEGAEAGYKQNHCEHCRDGEIASHNTGYFIVNAIRSRSQS